MSASVVAAGQSAESLLAGSVPNLKFNYLILYVNDESTEFKSLQVEKIFTKPTFSKLLPSRIHSVEEVEKVQNWILRRSTKWHAYRNYHDWFTFFLERRLEMFN
jgi:hypothetical protein